jgi:hypothetical protein
MSNSSHHGTLKNSNNSKNDDSWVDFELGEDVRDTDRLKQDVEWATAIADGRGHLSHRELTMLHAPQFCIAIAQFQSIEMLFNSLYDHRNVFHLLTPELLHIIVEYAFPGQAELVRSAHFRRELQSYIDDTTAHNKSSPSDTLNTNKAIQEKDDHLFKVCLRKRPLLPFEQNSGAVRQIFCSFYFLSIFYFFRLHFFSF